jgi:hypothetical protein
MKLKPFAVVGVAAVASLASPAMAQVQPSFTDVKPTDWAYQAIVNLNTRYGCLAGYPNKTFQPGKTASRSDLSAMLNHCLDNLTVYIDERDSTTQGLLNTKITAVSNRLAAAEKVAASKAQGVGNYLGAGVLVDNQGVAGNSFSANRVVTGGTVQGRYVVTGFSNRNAVSVRPYVNFVGGPSGEIGSGGGLLASYDISVAKGRTGVSAANVYLGAGYQIPFANGTEANFQSAVGNRGQFVGAVGVEGRLTDAVVGFADLKFPTTNAGTGGYSPVFTTGVGFKY